MKCFVPGCKSVSKHNDGKNNRSFFKAPKKEQLLETWQNAIPGKKSLKSGSHRICDLHFLPADISWNFEQKMPDGTLFTLRRCYPKLNADAVPSIFSEKPKSPLPYVHVFEIDEFNKKDAVTGEEGSTITREELPIEVVSERSSESTSSGLSSKVASALSSELAPESSSKPACEPLPKHDFVSSLKPASEPPVELGSETSPKSFFSETYASFYSQIYTKPSPRATRRAKEIKANEEAARKVQFLKICEGLDRDPQSLLLHESWSTQIINKENFQCLIWTLWADDASRIRKRIVFHSDMKVEIFLEEKRVIIPQLQKVETVADMTNVVSQVSTKVTSCCKADGDTSAPLCPGYLWLKEYDHSKSGRPRRRCSDCSKLRKSALRKITKEQKVLSLRKKVRSLRVTCTVLNRKSRRLKDKIKELKQGMKSLQRECAKTEEEALEKACAKLPKTQQLSVAAILSASKMTNLKGMRYSNDWVYECILLRTKSKKTYKHLQKHQILVLPSEKTLRRYIKNVGGCYGFQDSTFAVLMEKLAHFKDPSDLRGILLIDEMKLSKALSSNRQNSRFEGMTNLGKHTPKHQKNAKGDHALVIMFQPFKGGWIQSLGCFLSKGSASGTVLHELIMECIILSERAGLRIDGVTTDGATWNRKMWDIFGVTADKVSIEHIVEPSRRLWFFSDFPHLIKCLRNFFTKHDKRERIWTPDGMVSLKHWYAILDVENSTGFNLKINFNLTEAHLNPQFYQKMNVARAFQFFGVADAMELLKDQHPDLEDCEASVKFCRRVKNLITAMNCRTPGMDTLTVGNDRWNVIQNFLDFLNTWEREATERKFEFITDSTSYGLKISLKATLEICEFLTKKCDFAYLMTARLNQDSLERFFGLMRDCCGSNDHPDSTLFIQMYKLVSTYSLVKPPKGCNISGGEVLDVLLSIKDVTDAEERRELWNDQIDRILDRGTNADVLYDAVVLLDEHDYFRTTTSDYVITYVAGFVARRAARFTKFVVEKKPTLCPECSSSLIMGEQEEVPERHKLIYMKSKGYLYHPSIKLFELISLLERGTLKAVQQDSDIDADTIFRVTKAVESLSPLPLIGCEKHKVRVTHAIIRFYLTTRMFFLCKQSNKNNNTEKEATKAKRKLSKLTNEPDFDGIGMCYDSNVEKIAAKKPRGRKRKVEASDNKGNQSKPQKRKTAPKKVTKKRPPKKLTKESGLIEKSAEPKIRKRTKENAGSEGSSVPKKRKRNFTKKKGCALEDRSNALC